jgi:hypothetical protein
MKCRTEIKGRREDGRRTGKTTRIGGVRTARLATQIATMSAT